MNDTWIQIYEPSDLFFLFAFFFNETGGGLSFGIVDVTSSDVERLKKSTAFGQNKRYILAFLGVVNAGACTQQGNRVQPNSCRFAAHNKQVYGCFKLASFCNLFEGIGQPFLPSLAWPPMNKQATSHSNILIRRRQLETVCRVKTLLRSTGASQDCPCKTFRPFLWLSSWNPQTTHASLSVPQPGLLKSTSHDSRDETRSKELGTSTSVCGEVQLELWAQINDLHPILFSSKFILSFQNKILFYKNSTKF